MCSTDVLNWSGLVWSVHRTVYFTGKLSPGMDGWMGYIYVSLTPPTTRAPLAVLTIGVTSKTNGQHSLVMF